MLIKEMKFLMGQKQFRKVFRIQTKQERLILYLGKRQSQVKTVVKTETNLLN